jgi:hypothetical protein
VAETEHIDVAGLRIACGAPGRVAPWSSSMSGDGGNDVLAGDTGTDTLHGGHGTDTCSGGEALTGCE